MLGFFYRNVVWFHRLAWFKQFVYWVHSLVERTLLDHMLDSIRLHECVHSHAGLETNTKIKIMMYL